jgi:hypothetical protein
MKSLLLGIGHKPLQTVNYYNGRAPGYEQVVPSLDLLGRDGYGCDRLPCLTWLPSDLGSFGCPLTKLGHTIPLWHHKIYYRTVFSLQQKFDKHGNAAIYYKLSVQYQKQN